METVDFIVMADGSKADYELLESYEQAYISELPKRILKSLWALENSLGGYKVSRLEHCLQSASRAYRNGEDEELVIAALIHDIGDELAPYTHGEMAATILKPFASEKTHWIIKYHGLFQTYYYAHYFDRDKNARDQFKDHPCYQATVDFCEQYDQNCFDPDYDSLPLEFFAPMLRRFFSAAPQFNEISATTT